MKDIFIKDMNNTPRGYKLTLTRLDNGEEVINEKIDCLVGGYHRVDCSPAISTGVKIAACPTRTIITTLLAGDDAIAGLKDDIAKDLRFSISEDDLLALLKDFVSAIADKEHVKND